MYILQRGKHQSTNVSPFHIDYTFHLEMMEVALPKEIKYIHRISQGIIEENNMSINNFALHCSSPWTYVSFPFHHPCQSPSAWLITNDVIFCYKKKDTFIIKHK